MKIKERLTTSFNGDGTFCVCFVLMIIFVVLWGGAFLIFHPLTTIIVGLCVGIFFYKKRIKTFLYNGVNAVPNAIKESRKSRIERLYNSLKENIVKYLKLKKEQKENEAYEKKADEVLEGIEKEV